MILILHFFMSSFLSFIRSVDSLTFFVFYLLIALSRHFVQHILSRLWNVSVHVANDLFSRVLCFPWSF